MANPIEGLDDVLANIEALSNPKAVKKSVTKAARKAMNIVKKEAVKNAKALDNRKSPNKMWKSVTVKAKKTKNKGEVLMSVGMKGGAKKNNSDVYYWRFLEFGTVNSPAKPFLRPALYNNLDIVNKEFADLLNESLIQELNKV